MKKVKTKAKKVKTIYSLVDAKSGKTLGTYDNIPDLFEQAFGCKGFADCFRDTKVVSNKNDKKAKK